MQIAFRTGMAHHAEAAVPAAAGPHGQWRQDADITAAGPPGSEPEQLERRAALSSATATNVSGLIAAPTSARQPRPEGPSTQPTAPRSQTGRRGRWDGRFRMGPLHLPTEQQ